MNNHTNKPLELSAAEWQEIIELPFVRELWGLADETAEDFVGSCYGVKFDFESGGPGYCGDLYILHGDALSGPPLTLNRASDGSLESTYDLPS